MEPAVLVFAEHANKKNDEFVFGSTTTAQFFPRGYFSDQFTMYVNNDDITTQDVGRFKIQRWDQYMQLFNTCASFTDKVSKKSSRTTAIEWHCCIADKPMQTKAQDDFDAAISALNTHNNT